MLGVYQQRVYSSSEWAMLDVFQFTMGNIVWISIIVCVSVVSAYQIKMCYVVCITVVVYISSVCILV